MLIMSGYLNEAYPDPYNEYYELDRNKQAKKHPKAINTVLPKGAKSIDSTRFWNAYPNYKNYGSTGVWELIGGKVGELFKNKDSCAARVSYALNFSGHPIEKVFGIDDKRFFENDDGNLYIVSSFYLKKYMKIMYQKTPDNKLTTKDDLFKLTEKLLENQCALAIGVYPEGNGHSAVLKKGYQDPNTPYSIMDVWFLSP